MKQSLIRITPHGLYCEAGDFYIDPWHPVERAVITHAHSDHAKPGSSAYLCSQSGEGILRARIGQGASIQGVPFGETISRGEVRVSLHPAGHILGSAQVRVEHAGEVWVVTGDYKRTPDPSCEPFELIPCHTFISEATFGLPVYRWPQPESVFADIHAWWQSNREANRTSILFGYALGKAQRLLAGLQDDAGPIFYHGSIEPYLPFYRDAGVAFPRSRRLFPEDVSEARGKGLILAPGSTRNTPWLRKLAPYSLAFASGWMRIRGARRRQALDRGFVLSDHVDWPDLMRTLRETGAERVGLTHGATEPAIRWLRERGVDAFTVPTCYLGGDEAE